MCVEARGRLLVRRRVTHHRHNHHKFHFLPFIFQMAAIEQSTQSGLLPLKEADPELYDLIEKEKTRQFIGLELIASENFTSKGAKFLKMRKILMHP
jgi:hypothetical protein